ncbi:polymer-forming cytoskeletal protein [Pseudobutyrivibrio sp.]|uniref:Polymer-forming cytoskeletal protein n=1 Tax=Pseudobutyrivibrio ruminis TaxID=46206 RepID=A0A927U8U1_9FIRM|nr:polymer-forming cytoskeletal protein [Pseudobutyrivibrio sp.]MBE5919251.1 polymer-forming cytoskeletal protein [Pseudobutyrivibrio ruminis]MBQ6464239.1 polymer-forming cytoskeletal protein [Pseudobutyrivibrio sp.]
MGFFKDFKEDFNDALDEMAGAEETPNEEVMVNTLDGDIDVESELNKLDGLLEQVTKKVETPVANKAEANVTVGTPEEKKSFFDTKRETKMEAPRTMDVMGNVAENKTQASDENAVITAGMKITGNVESIGSIEVQGEIVGDVTCNGKLVITGKVNGNSQSSEFFADAAKIEGEVVTSGTAKVGVGSVIIGNITATSAVIAGAVKGDIDVNGPVVVDTSAVVMGNIKSRSVQINNGAVIEGFCSQSYSDVDVNSVFNI